MSGKFSEDALLAAINGTPAISATSFVCAVDTCVTCDTSKELWHCEECGRSWCPKHVVERHHKARPNVYFRTAASKGATRERWGICAECQEEQCTTR